MTTIMADRFNTYPPAIHAGPRTYYAYQTYNMTDNGMIGSTVKGIRILPARILTFPESPVPLFA
jgi:hypothetical protein